MVALDPSAPFAAAIRRLLPQATIVVDHFHLVRLANQMLTEVRQRVAREQLGRRGRKARSGVGAPPAAAGRRRPAVAHADWTGSTRVLHADDPTNEIGAAWGVKELLRQLLACTEAHRARRALFAFYEAVLRRRHARDDPAGRDDPDLVAGDRGVPAAASHQRPDRRHQQSDQADQACRLRLPQSIQLRTPYHPARRRQERGVTSVSEAASPATAKEPHKQGCHDKCNKLIWVGIVDKSVAIRVFGVTLRQHESDEVEQGVTNVGGHTGC
ncbi:MAG: transposase [Pyrinomonadaceae bacterium]